MKNMILIQYYLRIHAIQNLFQVRSRQSKWPGPGKSRDSDSYFRGP